MPRHRPSPGPGAFTLTELLVVLAVIGVLAGVSLSVLARARTAGRSVQCVGNLRQWGVALNLYANDNNGYYPRRGQGIQPITKIDVPEDWFNALPPYAGLPSFVDTVNGNRSPKPGDHSIFICPAATASPSGPYFLPYAMNMYLSPTIRPQPHNRLLIPEPSKLAFMADGPVAWSSTVPSSQGYSVLARHGGRANVCFVDGHVASFDGGYLGCGVGQPSPERGDIHWQPNAGGVDQPPVP